MRWGNEEQKRKQVKYLLEQYAFLKNPGTIVPYLPDALDVDISNRCNIKCITCFHSVKEFKPFPDMTMETFRNILEQADKGGASTITFGNHGETFIHKDIIQMIKEVKEKGFFLNIINNGTMLTPEKAQAVIDAKVDRLVFSLDSVDPEIYPQIRKGAKFEVTIRNILNFVKMNYEQGMKVYVNISVVNSEMNRKSKIDIKKYFSKLPVHVVYANDIINFQDFLEIRDETQFQKEYKNITDPKKIPVCLNGFDRLLFRPNGNVSLCAIDWNSVHIIGNINETPYYELWNNEKAQEFRRGLLERDYSQIEKNGILCSRCDGKWVQDITKWDEAIMGQLMESIEDTKEIMERDIKTEERYDNLLKEIKNLDKLGSK